MTHIYGQTSVDWRPGQPVTLDAPRCIIRTMTSADVTERYIGCFADPQVMHNITMEMNLNREQLLDFVASFDNAERFHLGVFLKESGLHIGWLKLLCDPVNRKGVTTTVVGDRDYWRQGFGFEMRCAAIDFMFGALNLHKVISMAYGDNPSTHALNSKLGFQREGILREDEVGPNGEWRDVHVFGLLAEEWQQRHGPA